ncbi:hypothetical protein [Ottowia sp. SB7-C50]|uniref:hypothetical protein n=1 Tax=Ottowia sp. SB7-C50 TaxID=3081231 RepID=UPI002955C3CA|nr:hypothetical protein [Ottowia sp. SB7-C50]WOP14512.1 hypothetical protein R0D99_11675 [Ottowia sp. SB7-C50]
MLAPDFAAIPGELRALPRWVVWRNDPPKDKVPYCPTAVNSRASSTDPTTWATFDQARTAYDEGGYLGVGFALNGDGIVGIDLDKCVNDTTPAPAALALLDRIGCGYVELSPSGTGLRGFGYADPLPKGKRGILDGLNVELYASARYLTVTGHPLVQGPLKPLPGFSAVAAELGSHLQKRADAILCSPLSSSVGIPPDTLPTQAGQRNACLFKLARYIKAANPSATRAELRAIAEEWHALALPVIETKDFAVTLQDFVYGFDNVQHPFGQTMQNIIDNIDATPLPAGIAALGYGDRGHHLVRLCAALNAHHAPEPFFLGARQAGEVIGVHYTDANKMLASLVADGVLTLVSKGAGNKASRYRFAWGMTA